MIESVWAFKVRTAEGIWLSYAGQVCQACRESASDAHLRAHPRDPSSIAATLFPVKLAMIAIAIALVFALLAFTVKNEGCLPWQERVGYGDGTFGEQEDVSRCDGSWFPFGSALVLVPH